MKKYCENCIYESLPYKLIEFKSNDIIFTELDNLDFVYRIKEGLVKITKVHYTGDEKVFDILGPKDYVALLALLQENENYIATATALTDVLALKIDKKDILAAYKSNELFQSNCMKCVVTRSKAFHNQLFNVSNISSEEKILSTLELLAKKWGVVSDETVHLKLPFSKTVLAGIIGIRRETLSRKLTEMSEKNIIEIDKNIYKFNRL